LQRCRDNLIARPYLETEKKPSKFGAKITILIQINRNIHYFFVPAIRKLISPNDFLEAWEETSSGETGLELSPPENSL
jgi:hypothetical protein